MKKIRNPFRGQNGYGCFGCSPDNENGLRLKFMEDGDAIVSEWEPKNYFQGYNHVLHGGIQATLIDEVASWFVYVKLKTAGVTSRLEVRYKKTVFTNKGKIRLRARLIQMRRNLADIHVELFDHDGTLCASGTAQYFTYPGDVARKQLQYPEPEDFYED